MIAQLWWLLPAVWLGGVVGGLFLTGLFSETDEERQGGQMASAVWPVVVPALLVAELFSWPLRLGRRIGGHRD